MSSLKNTHSPQQVAGSPLRQLTLNFGQKPCKTSAKTTNCKECGMLYDKNDVDDRKLHEKFHHDKEKTLTYVKSKDEKVVREYLDGKCVVLQWGVDTDKHLNKAVQILNYVDQQLGILNDDRTKRMSDQKSACNIKNLSKFYLFVSSMTNRIEGFCLAEPLSRAYPIFYLNETKSTFSYDETGPGEKVYCGISRIWVSDQMRRKNIGTRLLDCVCANFLYFLPLEKNQIAFSDPTEMGQALAKSFTKSDSFLVYNSNSNAN